MVAGRSQAFGRSHLDTLTSRMGLALAYLAAGAVPEARERLAGALTDAEDAHGAEHPETAHLHAERDELQPTAS